AVECFSFRGHLAGPPVVVQSIFKNNREDGVPPQTFGVFGPEPFFVDEAHGNFHLSPDSPAIGFGRTNNLPAEFPTQDLDGNPRSVNGKIDAGPYQFQGTRIPPPAYTIQSELTGD